MFDLPFELPDGWEVKTVDQLIKDDVIEKPLDGNHGGTHPKSSDYVEEGIPFVMASDLEAGKVNLDSCKFISEKQALTLRKGFSKVGDVLISHKATIGRTAIVQDNKYNFIMLTPQVTYYRIKNDQKLNNVYLKAYFDSSFFQTILGLWAGAGSTRAYLGITAQLKLPVIVPPIDKQLSIANHVGAINNKIELNCQTNQTLEQIAQAIFKSWFVDFEPVKAKIIVKEKGGDEDTQSLAAQAIICGAITLEQLQELENDYRGLKEKIHPLITKRFPEQMGLDYWSPKTLQKVADLFPNELVESELGEIPEGWDIKPLSDIAENHSTTFDFSKVDEVVFVNTGDVLEGRFLHKNYSSKVGLPGQAKKTIKKDDILYSEIRPKNKRFAYVKEDCDDYVVSTKFMIIRSLGLVHPRYLYQILRQRTTIQEFNLIAESRSGTFPQITFDSIGYLPIVVPPKGMQESFMEFFTPLINKIDLAVDEEKSLRSLREVLLPKLLSGEIELNKKQNKAVA